VTSSVQSWISIRVVPAYTATLFAITGTTTKIPAVQWDLNPDTIQVPANGTVTLSPKIVSGSGLVTLGTPQFDSGITVAVTAASITSTKNGTVTVTAGSTPGFYQYSIPGTDSVTTTTQSGYILVGNPAATFTQTGGGQSGTHGTALPTPLSVILNAGSSGGSAAGASVLFTTSAGTLSNGTTTGTKVIAVTNSTGTASVALTLPATAGTVSVTAEGQYALGHPVASFTETAK
jgi:hypothetical protein